MDRWSSSASISPHSPGPSKPAVFAERGWWVSRERWLAPSLELRTGNFFAGGPWIPRPWMRTMSGGRTRSYSGRNRSIPVFLIRVAIVAKNVACLFFLPLLIAARLEWIPGWIAPVLLLAFAGSTLLILRRANPEVIQ